MALAELVDISGSFGTLTVLVEEGITFLDTVLLMPRDKVLSVVVVLLLVVIDVLNLVDDGWRSSFFKEVDNRLLRRAALSSGVSVLGVVGVEVLSVLPDDAAAA